ncbi:hypothetical protein N4R57_04105 [Rhodobacteraceae bacterium D3-12]|nr:hypothetical protein N4R57_04105 [Rhodobacteraceae bacterium D3-12]
MPSVDTSTRNIVTTDPQPVAYNSGGTQSPTAGRTKAYVTGYSFWDNTPPGSARIARPVVHRQAGGTGTYNDPVTVAVGHSKSNGRSKMDFPTGTRFYFPNLQKYGIVEDLCGDGPRPQNGPCHTGYGGYAWLDIYVGGKSVGASASDRCMYSITGVQDVIIQPAPGLPVHAGEIALSNCRGA